MTVPILARSDHQKALGHRLKMLITALGLRNTQVSDAMGITRQGLNSILNGDSFPSIYGLYRLSRHQRVNVCDFLILDDMSGLPHWLAEKLEAAYLSVEPAASPEPERTET